MISETVRRNLIETGIYATLTKVYWAVAGILVVNLIICVSTVFVATPVAATTFLAGITIGLLVFMSVAKHTVKADKISRKWA